MYRCGFCGGLSSNRERQVRMVSETRQRIYEYRDKDGNFVQSVGYEIVKETLGHLACAEKASNNDVQEKILQGIPSL